MVKVSELVNLRYRGKAARTECQWLVKPDQKCKSRAKWIVETDHDAFCVCRKHLPSAIRLAGIPFRIDR